MADLGANVPWDGSVPPPDIAATGARLARWAERDWFDGRAYVAQLGALGISIVLVLERDSLTDDEAAWPARLAACWARYGDSVHYELGNEPDQDGAASWTMDQARYARLLAAGRAAMPDAYLIAGGLASGQPDWLQGVDLGPVEAIGFHPYVKEPGSLELEALIAGYDAYGLELWATEYEIRKLGMATCLGQDKRLVGAIGYCYSDSMYQGMGLIEDTAALADFRAAASQTHTGDPQGPWSPPPDPGGAMPNPQNFWIGPGLTEALERLGWTAIAGEKYFSDDASLVPCDEGALFWVGPAGKAKAVGWRDA